MVYSHGISIFDEVQLAWVTFYGQACCKWLYEHSKNKLQEYLQTYLLELKLTTLKFPRAIVHTSMNNSLVDTNWLIHISKVKHVCDDLQSWGKWTCNSAVASTWNVCFWLLWFFRIAYTLMRTVEKCVPALLASQIIVGYHWIDYFICFVKVDSIRRWKIAS